MEMDFSTLPATQRVLHMYDSRFFKNILFRSLTVLAHCAFLCMLTLCLFAPSFPFPHPFLLPPSLSVSLTCSCFSSQLVFLRRYPRRWTGFLEHTFFASVATRDKTGMTRQIKSKLGEKSNFNFCHSLAPELQASCFLALRKRTEASDINSALCVFMTA